MTYTYSISEPTFAETFYSIESETPLSYDEAYASARDAGSDDVEHGEILGDAPVIVEQTNETTGESKRLAPSFPLLDAFIAKYQLTSIDVTDVVGEGMECSFWKGDEMIVDISEDDYDLQTQGLLDVLGTKCGNDTELGGTLTPDDDGAYRFEGNITKRVIL